MLTLYINNQPADIAESSVIAITKTYESVHNPLLYYADYSKTIQLPVSARNNAIFSNFKRLDSTVTNVSIDPTKKIPAFILNNQEKVLEGYIQLNNANTIYTDEKYEVTFYSTLGLVMNELKLLTFNRNAVGIDPKYIIDSPLSDDLVINRNLVKQSFESQSHSLDGGGITDWIGFIPTYQGKYSDFSSDKEQLLPSGRTEDMTRERDEHYKREFRSYYQQPFIWVDKLWKVAKDKIAEITGYTLNLDASWFTGSNPYYKDLIYTCPSLFTSDDSYSQSSENYADMRNVVMFNKPSKYPPLSTHALYQLENLVSVNNAGIYDPTTGIFNTDSAFGSTRLKGHFGLTLFASIPASPTDWCWYCKIKDDNPFYLKLKAVNADTGDDIYGASKTFLLYSDDYDVNPNSFDEGIDLGVCNIANTGVRLGFDGTTGYYPMISHTGYQTGANHVWEHSLEFDLNVAENVPYRVYFEIWNANNGDPFEYTGTFSRITWDWLWRDRFNTSYGQQNDKGYSVYIATENVSCETVENLRTGSPISLYRVFPKDVTLCDVLLNYSKMFGLVWDVDDDSRTISVMTRNRFFADYRIEDWTGRVDRSKEFKSNPLAFDKRYVEFNYDEGKCGRLKKYESAYQTGYGTKRLDTGYAFNSDTSKLMEKLTPSVVCQKRQYSIMMNTEFEDRPDFMGYSYMVYPNEHYVDNDDDGKNAGMSGAFYFRNGTFAPDSRLSRWDTDGNYDVWVSDDTQHMIQTQEFCWNRCGEGITLCYALPDVSTVSNTFGGKRYSVHFEAPKEYYYETPDGEINYIYHSFWENYINERYCSQNKKLTAYVYLTIDEFKDIDFREFIKIDNILYHIDKIYDYNYNSDNPVKMDLVQVWNLSAYTEGQDEVPYLFTVPASTEVTTATQTVPVYTSYGSWHTAAQPSWVTAGMDGSGNLTISANSEASEYRTGTVVLMGGSAPSPYELYALSSGWRLEVRQYPTNPYRLEVDRNTVLFGSMGGSQTLTVDCHDTSDNAIAAVSDSRWIEARIAEYGQTFGTASQRACLHLVITAMPRTATTPRNGTVTLSITAGGTTYTQTVNVGQQGGMTHTRDGNWRLVTDTESDLDVRDSGGTLVTTLTSGRAYHFEDLFPEEVDTDSIQITGGGTVSITGGVGRQTVEFMPQLSDGDQVGGGMITLATLNGNIVSYTYDVQADGYSPVPPPPVPPEPDPVLAATYFYIEDTSGYDNTLSIKKMSSGNPTLEVFCSTDQENWETMGTTDTTPITATVPANGRLYLKCTADAWSNNDFGNVMTFADTANVGGNIMSLLYGDGFAGKGFASSNKYAFEYLFGERNSTLTDTKELVLPTNTSMRCYYNMFNGCTALVSPPALPATTLVRDCYRGMFIGCTGLVTLPTDLLPATALGDYCYYSMFQYCTSITNTPALPASTLSPYAYRTMFEGCSSLNTVTVYADDISATDCLFLWLNSVAATGDFYSYGTAVFPTGSPSGIPQGWTLHTTPPPVPTPPMRQIVVDAGEGGMFRIDAESTVMQPKTTNFFEYGFVDGTVIKLTAMPDDGMAFSLWSDGTGGTYTTPSVSFTVGSTLVGEDGKITFKPSFVQSNSLVTLTVYGGGGNGYITVGDDSTQYSPLVRKVAVGTTVGGIQAHSGSIGSFVKWSDGSTTNSRDITVMGDTTLTPIFVNADNQQLTIDGSGLKGANDRFSLSMDGTPVLSVGTGGRDTTNKSNATYALSARCDITDLESKFNWFKHTDSSSTNYYYANPASYNYQMTSIKGNSTITVSTVPSMVYWTNDDSVDYMAELQQKQDWLLDGSVFDSEKQSEEVILETDQNSRLTIAVTTDWKILEAIDGQGQDRLPDMQLATTDNGSWNVYLLDDTQDADKIVLHMG